MANSIGAIQVDLVADQTRLNAGIASAVGTAQAGGEKISNAFSAAAIKAATLQLSVDTLKQKLESLTSVGVRTAAQQQKMESTAARLAIANARLALSLEQIGHAGERAVTGVQATSGAIRVLEGSGGLRAVENFLSKTLGLGPAFQALFPIVGAIAFAEILGRIGEKIYTLWKDTEEATTNIAVVFALLTMRYKRQMTNCGLPMKS